MQTGTNEMFRKFCPILQISYVYEIQIKFRQVINLTTYNEIMHMVILILLSSCQSHV